MTTISATVRGIPRINLMPRPEVQRREREVLIRRWMWGVVAAVLVALLIIGGAFALRWAAEQRLAAEQAESDALLLELAALSDVSQALTVEQELTVFRSEAMGADFSWAPVVGSIDAVLPASAALVGYDFVSGGVPQGADPSLEVGLDGSITVASPDAIDIVATIRAVRGIPGVIAADGESITSSSVVEGSFAYLLTVTFDQSIYTGEYAIPGEAD